MKQTTEVVVVLVLGAVMALVLVAVATVVAVLEAERLLKPCPLSIASR